MSEIPSLILKETRKFANRLPNSNFLMQNMMKFISSVLQHLGLLPVCLPLKLLMSEMLLTADYSFSDILDTLVIPLEHIIVFQIG